MLCESNNATAPCPAIAPGGEGIEPGRVASLLTRQFGPGGVDPRVRALVPGFDAPFFQAGLCGYSDAAMRIVARRHGCPFCVTEALLDRTLLAGGRGFAKADMGDIEDNVPGGDEDFPLAGQIMGSDPREMAAAAVKMVEQGLRHDREYRRLAYAKAGVYPSTRAGAGSGQGGNGHGDVLPVERTHLRLPGGEQIGWWGGEDHANSPRAMEERAEVSGSDLPFGAPARTFATIDVNLACPVKKIDRKARGGHWLAEPEGAIAILEAVREAVPRDVQCTVKLRRSYDDTPEMAAAFERIFGAVYAMGYAWATVHARTVEQKYVGPSRWDILRDIVSRHPDKVVFGSGDVWNAGDIFRMVAYTGVSAVSVARGCIGNPWIFRQARDMLEGREPRRPTIAEQRAVLEEHFGLALRVNARMGGRVESESGVGRRAETHTGKTMRKFGIKFSEHHPRREEVKAAFVRVSSLEEWRGVLGRFYSAAEEAGTAAKVGAVVGSGARE